MFPSEFNPVFGVFVARHARGLTDRGVGVRVVANLEARGGWRNPFKYASLALRAAAAAPFGRYDVVVGHYLYPTAAVARLAARLARVPFVLVAHGTDVTSLATRHDLAARASRRALPDAAAIVAVSSALAKRLRAELGLAEETDVRVVHMGVDTELFRPDPEARDRLGWTPRQRVALFVGNLVDTKGPDLAIEAFAQLVREGSAELLVLVGDGPMRAGLEAQVAALGLEGSVRLTGRLAAPEVAMHMAAADVLLMPSRDEGLGLSALEALACGTPVVAARVGGVPEIVPESGCGELVPAEDPGAMSAAVQRVLGAGKHSYSGACVLAAADESIAVKAQEFVNVLWGVTAR